MGGDKFYLVYILYDGNQPVYVGCTYDLDKRMKQHRMDKKFDGYRIMFNNYDKKRALQYEKSLISFMVVHYPELTFNKQKRDFVMHPEYVWVGYGKKNKKLEANHD